jgi:hypothetical protein
MIRIFPKNKKLLKSSKIREWFKYVEKELNYYLETEELKAYEKMMEILNKKEIEIKKEGR